jgi:hypothetical protein
VGEMALVNGYRLVRMESLKSRRGRKVPHESAPGHLVGRLS